MRSGGRPRGVATGAAVRAVLALAVLGIAVVAAFAPALQADFVDYDDNLNFLSNQRFRGLSAEHLTWMFTTGWMGHYQPLSWVTLGADYLRAGGLDGPAFHRTNVFLHFLVAALFLLLAVRLYGRAAPDPPPAAHWVAALIAALLFAIHPLRVESVAWVTERRDVLSGLFFVAVLLVWVRGPGSAEVRAIGWRRGIAAGLLAVASGGLALSAVDLGTVEVLGLRPGGAIRLGLALAALLVLAALVAPGRRQLAGFLACLLLLLLSLLSKAWGLVMPALLLVLDFWPRSRGRPVSLLIEKLPFFVLSVWFGVLAGWAQASLYGTMKSLGQHGAVERIAQACYGLVFYPAKTLVPVSLGPFYDLPRTLNPFEPRFAGSALVVGAGLVVLVALARRGRGVWLAAFAAYAIIVSPVLGLAQSGPQLVAERYSYLATLPFALLGGGAALAVVRRGRGRNLVLGAGVAVLVVVALASLTFRQSRTWQNSEALWQHVRDVRPDHAAGWLWEAARWEERAAAASEPGERGRLLREALELLREGESRSPDPQLVSNQGLVYTALAREEARRAPEHLAMAAELQGRALQSAVDHEQYRPVYSLRYGAALVAAGRPEEALSHLQEFVRRRPRDAAGHLELGRAYLGLDRPGQARVALEQALALEPDRAAAWRELGRVQMKAGSPGAAARAFQRALALDPGDREARRLLAESLR